MKETATNKLPYPTDEEAPDGPTQIKALAEALDKLQWGQSNLAEAVRNALIPSGTVLATARTAPPTGFIFCEGQAVSRSSTTYKALFEAIGTKYGAGDGATTFNLPDLRGRVPVGVDGAAARMASNDTQGASGGEEKHTLTVGELAAHGHGVSDPGHGHGAGSLETSITVNERFQEFTNASGSTFGASGFRAIPNWGNQSNAIRGNTAGAGTGITIQNNGGGGSHNNMQPYQVVQYMIKL